MKRLIIFTLVSTLMACSIHYFKKTKASTNSVGEGLVLKKEWLVKNDHPQTPQKELRTGYISFLSFPEWHLVYCPEEQANFFKRRTASTFPFLEQSTQIWDGYEIMNNQVKDQYKVDFNYHLMIWVIGLSSSAEYSIKSWYETVVGRITDTHYVYTDEDKFNAQFTQEYVDFIKDRPWYEFDFNSRLRSLWSTTSFFDVHFLRKLERKYILTSELLVKYGYGKLIGIGSQSIYGLSEPTTTVVLESLPKKKNGLRIGKIFDDKSVIVHLPRYDKFYLAALDIAKRGGEFREIGGNTSAILITLLTPSDYHPKFDNTQVIFNQDIPSDIKTKRIAIATPVANLDEFLLECDQKKIKVEHVYDF